MALSYVTNLTGSMLISDIEAHVKWRNRVLHYVLFPTVQMAEAVSVTPPSELKEWYKTSDLQDDLSEEDVEKFCNIHQELAQSAEQLVTTVQGGQGITIEMYDAFEQNFETYVAYLRELEQGLMTVGASVDIVTRLRSTSGMEEDLRRELDRRDRKGLPFCICVAEIDDMTSWRNQLELQEQGSLFSAVAQNFLRTVRSFDDAYHYGGGKYLLCLKHIDLLGACAVMDRIRESVSKEKVELGSGDLVDITISIGVAEPVPGDKIEDVMFNADRALSRAQDYGGNKTEQHREMSQLEQYAHENLNR